MEGPQTSWDAHLPDDWRSRLSGQEMDVFDYKLTAPVSIAEIWAWRGEILLKHGFDLPPPEAMAMAGEDHPIYQPWQITRESRIASTGDVVASAWYRRGRKLKPGSRFIEKYLRETGEAF